MTRPEDRPFDADATAHILRAQGHKPDAEDLDRLRRIVTGELSVDDAYAEIDAQVAQMARDQRRRRGGHP